MVLCTCIIQQILDCALMFEGQFNRAAFTTNRKVVAGMFVQISSITSSPLFS